jgi:hypothetical protein
VALLSDFFDNVHGQYLKRITFSGVPGFQSDVLDPAQRHFISNHVPLETVHGRKCEREKERSHVSFAFLRPCRGELCVAP